MTIKAGNIKSIILLVGILLSLIFPASARAAFFTLDPMSASINVGERKEISLSLDTEGYNTDGVDLLINFDPALLEIESIDFSDIYNLNDSEIDSDKGSIKIYSTMDNPNYHFKGIGDLAKIHIYAKSAGESELGFVCSSGETATDSNIWHSAEGDIINCSKLVNGEYSLKEESCDLPSAPSEVKAVSGPGKNEVTLSWKKSDRADYYRLAYGMSSKKYQYGALNIGDTAIYTIRQLEDGRPYYFLLFAVNNCGTVNAMYEVMAYAGGVPVVVRITPEPPAQTIEDDYVAAILSLAPSQTPTPTKILLQQIASDDEISSRPVTKSWPLWLLFGPGVLILLLLLANKIFSGKKPKNKSPLDKKTDLPF